MNYKYIFILLISLAIISCKQEKAIEESQLGEISFELDSTEKANALFKEGMLLLHSFEYKDAARKFHAAQTEDKDFAMAYWGEAMTKNHTLWREQEKTEAMEILMRVGDTPEERQAKINTEINRDLFKGAEILFFGDDTKNTRDVRYRNHMAALYKKHPDNHEVAAFYALSVLGAVKEGRDMDAYAKGAKIAQGIIDENPQHPGALHYLIHSFDDPNNAPKALNAANSYAKVAPDANHALHMWDEVISSNKAAFAASQKKRQRKDSDNDVLDYHSLKWLMYGHLQKEEFNEARQLVVDMEKYCAEKASKKALSHLVMMKGAYFSETDKWGDSLSKDTFDYSNLAVQIKAVQCFNNAMIAFANDDLTGVKDQIDILNGKLAEAEDRVMLGGAEMCSGNYNRSIPTRLHIDRATVIKKEMKALVALSNDKPATFEKLMKEACSLEDKTAYMYGPPEIVKPSSEMYAEWLLKQGRNEEAEAHFSKVLARAPKRLIAMQGLKTIADNT